MDFKYIKRQILYFPIRLLYKLQGFKIGKFFTLGKGVVIDKHGFQCGDCVYIGQYSYIGPNTHLGNFCMLSDNVNIIGHDHRYTMAGTPTILAGRETYEPITILEDDIWIGHGVTIMRGITIGEGSIIAANSVVTKNIPPYQIYGGTPAKYIKNRFTENEENVHRLFLEKIRNKKLIVLHDRKPIYKKAVNE